MKKTKEHPQLPLPDIDQMALFDSTLPEQEKKRGLEDILKNGNSVELGLFIKKMPYKRLRIELAHCGYDILEIHNKDELIQLFWPILVKHINQLNSSL